MESDEEKRSFLYIILLIIRLAEKDASNSAQQAEKTQQAETQLARRQSESTTQMSEEQLSS